MPMTSFLIPRSDLLTASRKEISVFICAMYLCHAVTGRGSDEQMLAVL